MLAVARRSAIADLLRDSGAVTVTEVESHFGVSPMTARRDLDELERQGIATSRYLPSIHLQSYMRERYGFSEGLCPVSEDLSRRTLALPFYAQIDAEDQERVVEALRAAL